MTQRFKEIIVISLTAWAALNAILAPGAFAGSMASSMAGEDAASSSIRVETFRTHSRISFHVDDGVSSELKSNQQGFELFLKGIALTDLGAPLGEEAQWAARFKKMQDPRLGSLEFAEVAGGLRVSGQWKYGQGSDAPANPMMESFDYREHAHSALVIDFWVKEGPTVGEVKASRAITRRIASVKKHEDDEKARAARRVARERARAIAEDPKLFCRTPLSDRSDVFLQFNPVHEPVYFARWFSTVSPDADYSYYAPQGKTHDAEYVRLALKLYHEGNFALVSRTIDFFDQECPDSSFRSEMRFLRANAMLKLGLNEEAIALLKEIQREPKSSRLSLHAGMYLALKQYEDKNYLAALESFSWLSDHEADHRENWVFHLGAAECARALKQTDRAVKEYTWVAEHAPDASSQAEGALRMGDLYLDRFQYDQALAAYAMALSHFSAEAAQFPAVHINRADSLYGLGQWDRAAQAYREFLDKFPSHPSGWRAAYRLGELAGRKETATRESADSVNWYLETINRFPFSPGATLARLQLLPCGDHAGFTPEAADRFFSADAEKFDGAGEVAMERYKDFRALSRVRSLMTLGRESEAVAQSIVELQRVVRAEARRWLSHLLVFNFRRTVLDMLEAGQKLAALTFYQKNADTVPLTDGTVDPDYLLKLSQAASDLSLGRLGESINLVYEKARKSHETASRELASDQGGPGDTDVKLESSERAFTEAKALWVGQGMKAADTVRARLGQVVPESRFSYEREIILGLIEEKGGSLRAALGHAAQAQLLGPRNARVDAWAASLEARSGDPTAALAAYRALEGARAPASGPYTPAELLGVPAVPGREALILSESEILEKQSRWADSAANYARAVEEGLGGAEARYGWARALLKAGGKDNRAKAVALLEKLAAEESEAANPAPAASAAPGAPTADAKNTTDAAPASQEATPAQKEASASNNKFWRKLASETLADEKAKNGAKEGMKQ
jgi:tetratricopeptide (TPR) repeat protein